MEEKPDFKAAVEVSRKWDGNEVAIELSIKIKNKCPNCGETLDFPSAFDDWNQQYASCGKCWTTFSVEHCIDYSV